MTLGIALSLVTRDLSLFRALFHFINFYLVAHVIKWHDGRLAQLV